MLTFPRTSVIPEQVVHTPVKRGVGCQEINTTTYTTDGATFNILCDTSYLWTSILYLNYTVDFASCMGGCVEWNTKMSQKCLGVTWAYGQYGPLGLAGGNECYFFWDLSGSGQVIGHDSAQLEISGPVPVCSTIFVWVH